MGNIYIYEINIIFTIEVEHKFSKGEIKEAGSVSEAFKFLGEDILNEIYLWYFGYKLFYDNPFLLHEYPTKRTWSHKYPFSFIYTYYGCPFNEEEVDFGSGKIKKRAIDKIVNEWKNRLTTLTYPVRNLEVISGEWFDIVHGE